MNRKNNIGLGNGFHSSQSLSFALVTVCCLLVAGFMLLFAPCVMAADKLIVKDTEGNTSFVVTDTGKVGVFSSTPESSFHIAETTTNATRGLLSAQHNNGAQGAYTLYRKSRGTVDSPTPIETGDYIIGLDGQGFDGTAYQNTAMVATKVDGAVAAGSVPTAIVMFTGSSIGTGRGERMRITSYGNVGIGTTNPQGKLDVNGSIYQRGNILHADYVFEPTYKMECIEEHAKDMWTNKHLKAIPGVQKDENGLEIVEVGSHQRGILEELEKAHVYIEQLNERLKTIETKLKTLEQK